MPAGAATVANYQQVLRSVTFATNSSAPAAPKTVSMVVTCAKVSLGNKQSGDALGCTPPSGSSITGAYDAATGVLTPAGTATAAQYQSVLRSVNFATTTSTVASAARTFVVAVTDQQGLTGSVLLLMTVLGL